jgi:capsular polysaccharide biosynthesis protein
MNNNEIEIDLFPYIKLLVHNWWKILLPAIIVGGIATIMFSRQPNNYKSSANIILTSEIPTLYLAEQFPTVEQKTTTRDIYKTLKVISSSDEIAMKTFNTLQNYLGEDIDNFKVVKNSVDVNADEEILTINAVSTNPEIAVKIANEWARNATDKINQIYSGEQPLTDIKKQLEVAYKDYENAQSELENFLMENRAGLLETKIKESKKQLSTLSEEDKQRLEYYRGKLTEILYKQDQLSYLKSQLQSGNRSKAAEFGDAFAVLSARANYEADIYQEVDFESRHLGYFGDEIDLDIQFANIESVMDESSKYVSDIESLEELIQGEREKVENEIKLLTSEIVNTESDPDIEKLASNIQKMESEFEKDQARLNELNSQRDLAWQAYQAYAQKEAEIRNAPQVDNMVTIAGFAITPVLINSQGYIQRVIIASLFGAFLGVLWVFGEYWWKANKAK